MLELFASHVSAARSLTAGAAVARRVRIGLYVVLFSLGVFTVMDIGFQRTPLMPLLAIKALQAVAAATALLILRRPRDLRTVTRTAVAVAVCIVIFTSVGGIIRQDVLLATYLVAGMCLGSAAFVPWGIRPQVVLATVSLLSLAGASFASGGPDWYRLLAALPVLPVSVLLAAELAGYRAQRIQDEAHLRDSEVGFQQVMERLGEVFWVCDVAGRLIYVGPAFETIWGRPRPALDRDRVGWPMFLHAADRAAVEDRLSGAVEQEVELQYRILLPDGTVRWIVDRVFPIRNETGAVYRRAGVARDVTTVRDAAETSALRDLAAHLQGAREEERAWIAREIHDELGQVLTALKLQLSAAARGSEKGPLTAALATVDRSLKAVREIATALRPAGLDDFGLPEAMRSHAREFMADAAVACELEFPDRDLACDAARATALFRIFQEALTNVAKHASATHVVVRLRADDECITLEVADDGRGICRSDAPAQPSFGVLGMRERARLFGGTVEVRGALGGGTVVLARIPCEGLADA